MSDDVLEWTETYGPGPRPPVEPDLSGWEIHRERPGRRNARRIHEGARYQLKWFTHPARGALPAKKEFDNAVRVAELGIPAVDIVGWGRHAEGSFLVMRESPGHPVYHLDSLPDATTMRRLTDELAAHVARLHDARLCHRDLYLDHVLIDGDRLHVIDLGRLLPFRRRRWIVKDLGALLFSARREGIDARWQRRFLASYLRATARRWRRRSLLALLHRKALRYEAQNVDEDLTQRAPPAP